MGTYKELLIPKDNPTIKDINKMKYLKRFNESIEDIDSICGKYGIRNYTVRLHLTQKNKKSKTLV